MATEVGALMQLFLKIDLRLLPLGLAFLDAAACLNLELFARVLFRRVKGHETLPLPEVLPFPLVLPLLAGLPLLVVGLVEVVGRTEHELQMTSSSSIFLHIEDVVVLHKAHFGFKPRGILNKSNIKLLIF